mmetsp:Transcript_24852/g.62513  ORF Transcript_24852/g.62513 Transcript_24852/m.62513 type:complete len:761 (-) Transcript_24852:528-2810(-)
MLPPAKRSRVVQIRNRERRHLELSPELVPSRPCVSHRDRRAVLRPVANRGGFLLAVHLLVGLLCVHRHHFRVAADFFVQRKFDLAAHGDVVRVRSLVLRRDESGEPIHAKIVLGNFGPEVGVVLRRVRIPLAPHLHLHGFHVQRNAGLAELSRMRLLPDHEAPHAFVHVVRLHFHDSLHEAPLRHSAFRALVRDAHEGRAQPVVRLHLETRHVVCNVLHLNLEMLDLAQLDHSAVEERRVCLPAVVEPAARLRELHPLLFDVQPDVLVQAEALHVAPVLLVEEVRILEPRTALIRLGEQPQPLRDDSEIRELVVLLQVVVPEAVPQVRLQRVPPVQLEEGHQRLHPLVGLGDFEPVDLLRDEDEKLDELLEVQPDAVLRIHVRPRVHALVDLRGLVPVHVVAEPEIEPEVLDLAQRERRLLHVVGQEKVRGLGPGIVVGLAQLNLVLLDVGQDGIEPRVEHENHLQAAGPVALEALRVVREIHVWAFRLVIAHIEEALDLHQVRPLAVFVRHFFPLRDHLHEGVVLMRRLLFHQHFLHVPQVSIRVQRSVVSCRFPPGLRFGRWGLAQVALLVLDVGRTLAVPVRVDQVPNRRWQRRRGLWAGQSRRALYLQHRRPGRAAHRVAAVAGVVFRPVRVRKLPHRTQRVFGRHREQGVLPAVIGERRVQRAPRLRGLVVRAVEQIHGRPDGVPQPPQVVVRRVLSPRLHHRNRLEPIAFGRQMRRGCGHGLLVQRLLVVPDLPGRTVSRPRPARITFAPQLRF